MIVSVENSTFNQTSTYCLLTYLCKTTQLQYSRLSEDITVLAVHKVRLTIAHITWNNKHEEKDVTIPNKMFSK